MNTYATLLKHYRKYPGKVLPSFNHLLSLEHSPHACVSKTEALELQALASRALTSRTLTSQDLTSDGPLSEDTEDIGENVSDASANTRTCWLKIATGDVDRVGDTLAIKGVDLTNFLRNPQLLWMHGLAGLPVHTIGKIQNVVPYNNALYALAEYASNEISPFAEQIYQLDLAGFLPANSIGFHPIEWEKNESGGFHFLKWELIECSKVELPMNPNAIDDGVSPNVSSLRNSRYYTAQEAMHWLD